MCSAHFSALSCSGSAALLCVVVGPPHPHPRGFCPFANLAPSCGIIWGRPGLLVISASCLLLQFDSPNCFVFAWCMTGNQSDLHITCCKEENTAPAWVSGQGPPLRQQEIIRTGGSDGHQLWLGTLIERGCEKV